MSPSDPIWDLRPAPEALSKEYLACKYWDDRSLGRFLDDCLLDGLSRQVRIWSRTRPFTGTVGEVRDMARRVAAGLGSLGVGPGDIVAFQLPNWVEAAATFYGIAMTGAIVAPIVHFYGPKETRFILAQSGARVLITADRFAKRDFLADLAGYRDELGALENVVVVQEGLEVDHSHHLAGNGTVPWGRLVDADPIDEPAVVDPEWPALVAYTSGTTSDPKGVIHSHRTIGFEVRQLAGMQADRDLPLLTAAPVGHGIGMLSGLLVPLYRGHPLNLMDVWEPQHVLDAMLEADLSAGSGSTYFFTSLLDAPGFGPEHLKRMRMIGLGGSPIPVAVAERADQLGVSLVRSYGSTEHPSTTGSTHNESREKRLHTDGRPREGVEVRVVSENGKDLDTTRTGEITGEILSRGPDRFVGYTDSRLTDEAIDEDGWFATGDVGFLDAEGFLTVTDRKKDIIIRGGENVSAAEVEEQLARMTGVAEVAVVAAPDPRLGEHGCAFFRMQAGAPVPTLDLVRSHLDQAGLAKQKWPEEVRPIQEFPRTPSGKIQKFVLRAALRSEAWKPGS